MNNWIWSKVVVFDCEEGSIPIIVLDIDHGNITPALNPSNVSSFFEVDLSWALQVMVIRVIWASEPAVFLIVDHDSAEDVASWGCAGDDAVVDFNELSWF